MSLLSLPEDVLHEVLDKLALAMGNEAKSYNDDPTNYLGWRLTLYNVARTNRTLHRLAIPYLYRSIFLPYSFRQGMVSLLRSLATIPDLGKYTRTLALSARNESFEDATAEAQAKEAFRAYGWGSLELTPRARRFLPACLGENWNPQIGPDGKLQELVLEDPLDVVVEDADWEDEFDDTLESVVTAIISQTTRLETLILLAPASAEFHPYGLMHASLVRMHEKVSKRSEMLPHLSKIVVPWNRADSAENPHLEDRRVNRTLVGDLLQYGYVRELGVPAEDLVSGLLTVNKMFWVRWLARVEVLHLSGVLWLDKHWITMFGALRKLRVLKFTESNFDKYRDTDAEGSMNEALLRVKGTLKSLSIISTAKESALFSRNLVPDCNLSCLPLLNNLTYLRAPSFVLFGSPFHLPDLPAPTGTPEDEVGYDKWDLRNMLPPSIVNVRIEEDWAYYNIRDMDRWSGERQLGYSIKTERLLTLLVGHSKTKLPNLKSVEWRCSIDVGEALHSPLVPDWPHKALRALGKASGVKYTTRYEKP